MKKILYIVIPCFNEEDVLKETTKQLKKKIESLIKRNIINKSSQVMYVNDGSSDKTWNLIEKINKTEKYFTGISLSKNMGHQNCSIGWILVARKYADIIISMDADLQDDIDAIDQMINKYLEGSDIVYGVRNLRKKDTWFKRTSAQYFYRLMNMMGVNIIYNHADYRLASKEVLDHLEEFNETNLFLRRIFPLIGYKSDIVYYERKKRIFGKSKYSLSKMFNFAWDGITSFSIKPIRMILSFGIILSFFSFILLIIYIYLSITLGIFISLICFLSGLEITFIGIIGEYVGKTYFEAKKRPRYIISKNLLEEKNIKNVYN